MCGLLRERRMRCSSLMHRRRTKVQGVRNAQDREAMPADLFCIQCQGKSNQSFHEATCDSSCRATGTTGKTSKQSTPKPRLCGPPHSTPTPARGASSVMEGGVGGAGDGGLAGSAWAAAFMRGVEDEGCVQRRGRRVRGGAEPGVDQGLGARRKGRGVPVP
jgi:hypothetical protein